MKYHKTKLSNGLRVITVPMPSLESVTVTVWVGVGSRWEKDDKAGISHFLEHMVFKGSKKRPTAHDISSAVDSFGGEFNASTSKEWTNFYIKSSTDNVKKAFDVLSDMVLNPLIRQEDIDREKGVIVEEIGMYEDTPRAKVEDHFEQLIYKGSDLGRDIIGTRKTVKSLMQKDFVSYRNSHYFGDNMLVTVAGGVTEKQALALVKEYFSGVQKKSKKKVKAANAKPSGPKIKLVSKENEQAHFILGFLGNPMGHKDRYVEAVLASVLGGGMSARMFTEVREKRGLAYAVKTGTEHYVDTGYMSTYTGVDPKKAEEAIKVVLDQHYGLASEKYPVTDEELTKAKEYLKGHIALSLEDTRAVSGFFGAKEILLGKVSTPDEVFEGIEKATKEDVVRVAKEFFVPERLSLAINGPFKDKKNFSKLIK